MRYPSRVTTFFFAVSLLGSSLTSSGRILAQTGSATNSTPPGDAAPGTPAAGGTDATKDVSAAQTSADAEKSAVASALRLSQQLKAYKGAILAVTGRVSANSATRIEDLQSLKATLAAISQTVTDAKADDLDATVSAVLSPLDGTLSGSKEKARADACAKLTSDPADTKGYQDALNECSDVAKTAADTNKELGDALKALKDALPGIYDFMQNETDGLAGRLKPLCGLAADAKADDVLKNATANFGVLNQVLVDRQEFGAQWSDISRLLNALKVTAKNGAGKALCGSTQAKDTDDLGTSALANLDAAVGAIAPNLGKWAQTISADLQNSAAAAEGAVVDVETDPRKNSGAALDKAARLEDKSGSAQAMVDAWAALAGNFTNVQAQGFDLDATRKQFDDLAKAMPAVRLAVSHLHEALAGDFSQFDTDQVSLYYFTDVKRLMDALNDTTQRRGGSEDAQKAAAEKRKILVSAEMDLADAQAKVSQYQQKLDDLKEQQRQSSALLKNLDATVSRLASRVKSIQTRKDKDAQALQAAQKNTNGTTSGQVTQLENRDATDAQKASQANSDLDAATKARDDEKTRQQSAQNDADGLPNQIAEAQKTLSDAQTAVAKARRDSLIAAQEESDAFALARDNTPYLVAWPDASSTDPVKRVIMYAFNDSKTIFLRGAPDDLVVVRHIISDFDRPVPQARLTLWTFELDADLGQQNGKAGAAQLNQSMEIVDQELGNTRALINTTLGLLRKLISDQVQCAVGSENMACASYTKTALPNPIPWFWNGAAVSDKTPQPPALADEEKLKRVDFYDPAVLKQLNFDQQKPDLRLLRGLLPDPAGTTTLGEALMVLSLARPAIKQKIHDDFEAQIQGRVNSLDLPRGFGKKKRDLPLEERLVFVGKDYGQTLKSSQRKAASARKKPDAPEPQPGSICPDTTADLLVLTWHALGVWGETYENFRQKTCVSRDSSATISGLTAKQLEITRALKTAFDASVLHTSLEQVEAESNRARAALTRWKQAKAQQDATRAATPASKASGSPAGDEETKPQTAQSAPPLSNSVTVQVQPVADSEARAAQDQLLLTEKRLWTLLNKILPEAYKNYRTPPQKTLRITAFSGDSLETTIDTELRELQRQRLEILNLPQLRGGSPRVAAGDEMLKEMIIAVEDDLDRLYGQPMIERLRLRLSGENCAPRKFFKIVPGGCPRVGIFQRETMLASNRGVARVDPRASAQLPVGDQDDILSSVQQLAQLYAVVQSGGALAALGALQQQPREPQPEIYALTTGNKFQVTPVFDPSGQALRFKFDFLSNSDIKEPNGTTNPQMPRVERHTVNTEVQLSNFETREISRFESNARLGLPTTYWGGVPVLKDIPYVRPWVPLVGWFVRKGGTNSVAQQSVIFGQTTMYPSIGDIVKLLADQSSLDDLSNAQ